MHAVLRWFVFTLNMVTRRNRVIAAVRCCRRSERRMSIPSPYAAPEKNTDTKAPVPSSDLYGVRAILYIHLAAILLLGVFSLSDSGLLEIPAFLHRFFHERFVQIMLLMPWFACPISMVLAAARLNTRSHRFRIGIVTLDVVLSLFQTWVMLPLVQ